MLLKTQNPEVPTDDWKVLSVSAPPPETNGGQHYILQINKEAEDLLYARFGKMSWGVGSVYLRLKKRNPNDNNKNTLESGEVEKDLGFEEVTEAALGLNLNDAEGGSEGGATTSVDPKEVPSCSHEIEGPSAKPS